MVHDNTNFLVKLFEDLIFTDLLYSLKFLRVKIFAVEPDSLFQGKIFANSRHFLNECMHKYFEAKIFIVW